MVYKPGTKKKLSPRIGVFSPRWGNLVLAKSGATPSKKVNKEIRRLWALGYSHKDASNKIAGAGK